MRDRDFNAKEGNYTQVMNEFIDKLIVYPLHSNEYRILMLLIRKTWGINGRPYVHMSWGEIRDRTKLANSSLIKSMRSLKARNIIHSLKTKGKPTRYKINSKVGTWKEYLDHPSGPKIKTTPVVQVGPPQWSKKDHPSGPPTLCKETVKKTVKETLVYVPSKKELNILSAKKVIDAINSLSGKHFRYSPTSIDQIIARLNSGFTEEDCLTVVVKKWNDPDHKEKYFRPTTLFRPSLFEGYLNEEGKNKKPSKQEIKTRKIIEVFARRQQNEKFT